MHLELSTGWTVHRDGGEAGTPVTLPHDAMIHEQRDPRTPSGPASGYYPGGSYVYRRTIVAPESWQGSRVSLRLDGAYRRSVVRLNGEEIAVRPSGYAAVVAPLDGLRLGEDNVLEVSVDTTPAPDARWYTGSGLYRRAWLVVDGPTRFDDDGVRFRTVSVDAGARVEVEVTVLDDAGEAVEVEVELARDGATVASATVAAQHATAMVVALDVDEPALWSAEHPALHDLVVRATRAGAVLAEYRARVGIRVVTADAARGLLVNGRPTLLRGGCLHHDNGVLGAATFADAERRRVEILKQVGFNAIRTGHTPISRELLDACDELGVYVMDELTDVWFRPKGPYDGAHDFRAWWRRDLAAMVEKDRNHPSVILYSIGNENGETALDEGIAVGRDMVRLCHELDPTRLVTAGVNPFLNALASVGIGLLNMGGEAESEVPEGRRARRRAPQPTSVEDAPKLASSTLINHLMNALNDKVLTRPRLPRFDTATRGIFAELDVAGYNYGVGQYALHAQRHPDRVILGTETNPKDIVRNWNLVEAHPWLIGDFMWTAMDYLGEAGIGSWTYGTERVGLIKPFPWLTADCGAVDLTGRVTAAGLLARAAWGEMAPSIVVRPPHRVGVKKVGTNWRGTDAIDSWSWRGDEGARTEVLVYSAAPFVELLQDGRSIGRARAGRADGCTASFAVDYIPGELVAVAYDARGGEVGRSRLATAGADVALRLEPERRTLRVGEQDLAFVRIRLADTDGVVLPRTGVALTARVEGAATLAGFGSADPKPPFGFVSGFSATFHGEAIAVVRAGAEPGEAELIVTSDGFGERRIALSIV